MFGDKASIESISQGMVPANREQLRRRFPCLSFTCAFDEASEGFGFPASSPAIFLEPIKHREP